MYKKGVDKERLKLVRFYMSKCRRLMKSNYKKTLSKPCLPIWYRCLHHLFGNVFFVFSGFNRLVPGLQSRTMMS